MARVALSNDLKYGVRTFTHQLLRNDTSGWLGGTTGMIKGTVQTTPLSIAPLLWPWASTFKYARLLGITYKIEWKGTMQYHRDTGDTDDTATWSSPGESLYVARSHEHLNRGLADTSNQTQLPLAHVLGMNDYPMLFPPHIAGTQHTTPSGDLGSPDMSWNNLKTDKRVKRLNFTKERNIHYVKFKPLGWVDRRYATYDLERGAAANTGTTFDDDMRCGALHLYRDQLTKTGFEGDVVGTNVSDAWFQTMALYEITATVRVFFYGEKALQLTAT